MKFATDSSIITLCLLAGSLSAPAFAQVKQQDHDDHRDVEEIIVSSDPIGRSKGALAQGIAVIEGDRLERSKGLTLGATLDKVPGISQSSFGPAASRPIIRGLGGDRIRILTAGIGSIDASATSPDHAVAVDPETAESIEVLRGPATLLFGNNAVGGVVNIFDGRIPTKQKKTLDGSAKLSFATNGDEVNGSMWLNGPIGDSANFHFDVNALDRDNMSIPGFAESAYLMAAEEDEGEEHGEEEFGVVDVTDAKKKSGAFGVTYFGETGYIGFSVSGFNTNYGVPGHHHEEEELTTVDVDTTRIDLTQYRADMMGEWQIKRGFLDTLRMRFGYADYKHEELEGNEVGTTFFNKGYEGRIEGRIRAGGKFSGAIGVQYKHRDFEAIGDESFLPPSITNQAGAFFLGRLELNKLIIESGVRLESQSVNAETTNFERDTTGLSVSGSMVYTLDKGWRIATNGFRTERAPNVEELLSFGPHVATHTFEVGNPNLGKETARGAELSLRQIEGELTGSLSVFYTDYQDFIFQEIRVGADPELPDAIFTATDAKFWGIEGEINWHMLERASGWLELTASFDLVRTTNKSTGRSLPRIPPASFNLGAEWTSDRFDYGADVSLTTAQKRITPEELPTKGFVDIGAHINFRPKGNISPLTLSLEVRNLLNSEIRHHTSFLKDLLPEQGRDIRFVAKYRF